MGYRLKYQYLEQLVPLLEEGKEHIFSNWLSNSYIEVIASNNNLSAKSMEQTILELVFSNIIKTIQNPEELHYSYGIDSLIHYFFDNAIDIDDVHAFYMKLQQSVLAFLFTHNAYSFPEDQDLLFEVHDLFEYNLSPVLKLFLDLQREKEALSDSSTENFEQILKDYKAIVDLYDSVVVTDAEGIITFVNEKFCELSEYTTEELLGQNINIVRHLDSPKSQFKEMWHRFNEKESWTGELKNFDKKGATYYIKSAITPVLDNQGDIQDIIAIQHDITAAKEEERDFKSLCEKEENVRLTAFIETQGSELVATIPLPSFIINDQNMIIEYNDAFIDLFNLEKHAELLSNLEDFKLDFTTLLDKKSLKRFESFTEDWMTLYQTLYSEEPLMMKCEVDFLTKHYEVKWSIFKGVKTLACLVRV